MWTTTERATISLSPPSTPRLRLRPRPPPGSPRTPLDGAWWPRSAEPPGLILALQAHTPDTTGPDTTGPDTTGLDTTGPHRGEHDPIAHIMLRVADWTSRPRRLRVDGPAGTRVVRLSWFDTLPAGLLTAIWADGRRVDLPTIPPGTGPDAAAAGLDLAADPDNHLHTRALLAALTPNTPPDHVTRNPDHVTGEPDHVTERGAGQTASEAASENIWETEGGRLREPAP
ncbi:DUF5994 family protein [Actinomadura sp. 1N219]|uniref:DUF5994 family protein n=1 Tax=Actinomadura sp. 1N219 TaxID=3375152 RepID=UPI003787321D